MNEQAWKIHKGNWNQFCSLFKEKRKNRKKEKREKKKPYTLLWVYSVSVLPSQLHTDSWIPQNMCRGGNGSQSRYCLPKQSFRIPFFRTGMRSEISWFRSQYSQECLDSERHVERQETTEAEWQTCWWNKKDTDGKGTKAIREENSLIVCLN